MKIARYILPILAAWLVAFQIPHTVKLEYPVYFPKPIYSFEKNPLTESGIALGRMLFYDPILSADSTISCASCHSPFNAFAHTDHDLSHGIRDSMGTRNAPALFNLAWQPTFMWDGAANHLDVQALAPLTHPAEMGETIENVVKKVSKTERYPQAFEASFGDPTITGERLLKALAQFQVTLVSATARFDSMKQGLTAFTQQEYQGYLIFKENCNTCHTEPLFSSYQFANNGLPIDTTLLDSGRAKITQQPADLQLFKIPSLRNLSFSYPYMHDGRFKKLSQVLNHYTQEMQPSPTLSPALKTPPKLTNDQKTDLLAFLLTLNDRAFVFNPAHQFPK